MDHIKLLEKAKVQINNRIAAGSIFEVKNLFDSDEWNDLSRNEQKQLREYFSLEISGGNIPDVRRIRLAERNEETLTLFIRL